MPRVLELFSGTGSIGRAFERLGWTVTSLDINPKFEPTHVADILSWNFKLYRPGHFDFVWASPVCTQYSIARTCGPPRDLHAADRLVVRALEVIAYVWVQLGTRKPTNCVAENAGHSERAAVLRHDVLPIWLLLS